MDIKDITSDDMMEFSRTDDDKSGRSSPIKIILNNGDIIYGHTVSVSYSGEDFNISLFKQIENIEDWNANSIQFVTKSISLSKRDIKDISVYNAD